MSAEPPIAWTLFRAAQEFGLHRDTLKKRFIAAGIATAEDGTFSTSQICAAIYGDYQAEKTKLAKEQAEKVAIDNEERRGELIRVEDALEIAQRFCHAIRQRLLASSLVDGEKNDILKDIRRLETADFTEKPDGDEKDPS